MLLGVRGAWKVQLNAGRQCGGSVCVLCARWETQASFTEDFRGSGLGLNEMRGSRAGKHGAWLECCDVADFGLKEAVG